MAHAAVPACPTTRSTSANAQELTYTLSGGLGEAETGGPTMNVVPRTGGNTFAGSFFFSGANSAMQGSNLTQELRRRRPERPE